MPVKLEIDENTVIACLCGEIDHHSAAELRETIDRAVESAYPQLLILDFGGVTFMDSSGIGLVMGRWKLMKDLSGIVKIENAPPYIRKVMRMAGIDKLIGAESEERQL